MSDNVVWKSMKLTLNMNPAATGDTHTHSNSDCFILYLEIPGTMHIVSFRLVKAIWFQFAWYECPHGFCESLGAPGIHQNHINTSARTNRHDSSCCFKLLWNSVDRFLRASCGRIKRYRHNRLVYFRTFSRRPTSPQRSGNVSRNQLSSRAIVQRIPILGFP